MTSARFCNQSQPGALELLESVADPQSQIDPIQVFEEVITGIGFPGAGAMFREGSFVRSARSTAAIWAAGTIGLVCGFGEIWLASILTGVILTTLIASTPFTSHWDPGEEEGRQGSGGRNPNRNGH